MKKLFSLILAVVLCVGMTATASAAEKVHEGTCGTNITWVLDDDGTLTISGTGEIKKETSDFPWFQYRDSIHSIVINEGVTGIERRAFYYCSNLTTVFIPSSVTVIGNYAFAFCPSLTTVKYNGTSEPTAANNIFYGCVPVILVPNNYTASAFAGIPVTPSGGSDPVTLTVSIEPNNLIVTEGKIIEGTLYQVTASDNSTPSYQWYQCDDASKTNAQKLKNATSMGFYVPTNLTAGQYYFYCVASAEGSQPVTSRVLTVTVKKPYQVAIIPDPAAGGTAYAKVGSSTITQAIEDTIVTLINVPAEGYLFKEWQVISGGTTVANDQFKMGTANVEIKAVFEKKVDAQKPAITAQPVPAEYTVGSLALPLRVIASVTDGGTLTYQWYQFTAVGGIAIPGATNPTFTPPTDSIGEKNYRCFVTNTNNSATGEKTASVWSDSAKVVVIAAPVVPQTGDSTPLMLLALLMTISLAGTAMTLSRKRRTN